MSSTPMPPPEVTDELRAQAKSVATGVPGSFLVVDPDAPDSVDGTPPWAIRGGYPLSADGDLDVEGYRSNPKYRPGPRTCGLPLPENRLERALELAATGYAPRTTLLVELRDSSLILPVLPGRSTGQDRLAEVPVGSTDDGAPLLVAYTSSVRVPEGLATVDLPVRALAGMLDGVLLQLNAGSVNSLMVPGVDLAKVLAAP